MPSSPVPGKGRHPQGKNSTETEAEAGTPVSDGKEGAELTAVAEGGWHLQHFRALLRDLSANQNLSLREQLTQN